jgi:hypothetical protein
LVEGQAFVQRQGRFAIVRVRSRARHTGGGYSLVTIRQRFGDQSRVRNFRLVEGSRLIDFQERYAMRGSRARVVIIIIVVRTCTTMSRCSTRTYNTTASV